MASPDPDHPSAWLAASSVPVMFPSSYWGREFQEMVQDFADDYGVALGELVQVHWAPIGPWLRVARAARSWPEGASRYGGLSRDRYVAELADAIRHGYNVPPLISFGPLPDDEEVRDDESEGFVDGIHRTLAAREADLYEVPVIDLSLVQDR